MPAKVVKVLSESRLVINVGSNDGVQGGERFMVYSLDEEIIDPDSGESLGVLEIVKGTGKVEHIQEKMCTIFTDMKEWSNRVIHKTPQIYAAIMGFGYRDEREEIKVDTRIPFDEPQVGDYAKRI